MRALNLESEVIKFLKETPVKHYRQIVNKIFELMEDPTPSDSKKLKGYETIYRVSSGEYRILYEFDEKTVFIWLVGLRNDDDIYKQLKRKS